MDEENIKRILDDVYSIEPDLRSREGELRSIILKLLAARPDTGFDAVWAGNLREKVISSLPLKRNDASDTTIKAFLNLFSMKKIHYGLGAFAVIAMALVATLYSAPNNRRSSPLALRNESEGARSGQFISLGRGAFGPLSMPAMSTGMGARPQGGGGGGGLSYASDVSAPMAPAPVGLGSGASEKMMAPPSYGGDGGFVPTMYSYAYKGDYVELSEKDVEVLRKARGMGTDTTGLLDRIGLGMFDPSKLANPKLQSVNLVEDRDSGYQVSVNFSDGSIAINENWPRWNHPESRCRDQRCYESLRLRIEDVPADAVVVDIARRFLADWDIDLSKYGTPYVMDEWRRQYDAMPAGDRMQYYIPDAVSVIFPQNMQGKPVYDEGGGKSGLVVSVNIREKKASGVWGLAAERFERSLYAAETDFSRIVGIAEKGGFRGGYYPPEKNTRVLEIQLGTPELAYVRIWHQREGAAEADELLVPALVFPVTKVPAGEQFWQRTVTVPLASELIANADKPYPVDGPPVGIMPVPMPMEVAPNK